ncbi:MAG: RagB/SusD family nutrient uptake outer membrane protein [Prolixibacteraceae bacterium]|nr:RagB/SusD family nutrient uptake outer membrane protein [Prolixibacteraceae bacterium]
MKMIKYIAGIWFLLLLVSMVSCESDSEFLTEEPETFYTVDNAFTTSAQVDQVLVSIYSHLRDLWANPNESGWIFVFRGNGTDMFDVASIRKSSTFNNYGVINPDNGNFYENYTTWYYVIARANLALYAAELPQISWSSEAEKAYAVAQARFFRAFAYRNLAELFGGVPLVTTIFTTPKYDFARATRVETYQFAITELEAIEADLPETTTKGGRLVKGAAQHNLCELYLAMGTQLAADGKASEASAAFAKSIAFGNKVIDGGTYSLMSSRFGTRKSVNSISVNVYQGGVAATPVDTVNQTANHYWDLFQEGNVSYQDGNKECIWAMQVDYAAYKAEDKKSKLPYSRTYGGVFRDGAKAHTTGTLEDVGGRGISQIIPTMYTRDDVYADKWGADMRNSDIVLRRRFKGNVAASPYFKKVIPWTVFYEGGADATTNKNNSSLCYPISCKIATDKYTGLADGENMSNLFRDDYFIRLSETILLRAEAKQRSGDKAGAAADINLLRDRANCTYKVTAADMDDNFNMILDERARELVYEECRWNTLLRMGGTVATDRIKKYAYWPEAAATLTFNYNLWPIPQTVIDTNKDVKLEQNPGWASK